MFHGSFSTKFNTKDIVGNVTALLVGIEYRHTGYELIGCIKDVLDVKRQILTDYPQAKITLLTDDTAAKPTRDNILTQLKTLVANSKAGDHLFFHYSGHGSQVVDETGKEADGMNETICPINFTDRRTALVNGVTKVMDSQIIDDEIHAIISTIPKEVKFLMVFDSCHSGTIGDLKYDFAHYHGPNTWQDGDLATSQETVVTQTPTNNQDPNTATQVPSPSVPVIIDNSVINCQTSWIYVAALKQLWITPLDNKLYQELVGNKFIVPVSSNVPMKLFNNPNNMMMFNSKFKKLENGKYAAFCAELGINNLIINSQVRTTSRFSAYDNPNVVSRSYDPRTGKHYHRGFGTKRTFSLRSVAGCSGGELRIIAGCEENQTSAGTPQYGGACTNAVLTTIRSLQGFKNFFTKIFSHNLLELKAIEDAINKYLTTFGYTQHSIISWEHASGLGSRMLLPSWQQYTSGINMAFLPTVTELSTRNVNDQHILSGYSGYYYVPKFF